MHYHWNKIVYCWCRFVIINPLADECRVYSVFNRNIYILNLNLLTSKFHGFMATDALALLKFNQFTVLDSY